MKNISLICIVFIISGNLFLSCGSGNNEEQSVHFKRFEQLLFSSSAKKDLYSVLKQNEHDYRFLLNRSIEDTSYMNMLEELVNDSIILEINDTVQHYFSDLSWLEKEVSKSILKVKKHFPEYTIPNYYTLVSGDIDYPNRVMVMDSFLVISLDVYVSAQFKKYGYFDLPMYLVNTLNKEELLPDCISEIGKFLLHQNNEEKSLLDYMIKRGKVLYFMDKVLPKTPDHLKIRYTNDQMEWCKQYESQIWGYIIEKELLYVEDYLKIRHLINEGPTTQGFENSPARMGEFIGWQIVKKYMSKNSVSMKELFSESNAQKILTESGYKPKKSK